ncbi:Gfo/Idh/MocA family oxidoreductase [Pseudozobellia thermophila]|uniref:Oxidoreductase family, C-terminal alpha/beta domain n=1 Tax=Pseudozobellia thermophila TaxID=192903 RepID=A0A1M6HZY5_9FLAO|nr:Gfo/Idh/MocA family oxidoreductase [Pseudozobellia thermophila]SHJ27710.1 Oxidoreductase family, C-terminal alpha/beta domain [Pseudozobellia thermophila]
MTNSRRKFISSISMLAASTAMPIHAFDFGKTKKLKVVLVGTGVRGTSFWGKRLVDQYSDILEFVGLCDINPGRLEYGKKYIGTSCPTFTDFEKMVKKTKPELVIVTTKDSTHHEFIIKGLEMGCDVLTEKPLTTDEDKCQAILDAERKSDKKLIVGFNYRWSPYATKVKELLMNNAIGKLVSVDFHWYLNTYHGASYFRRWHGEMESGGSLWVHKSTHHFDLLNWWIDSEPSEVFAYGDLEFYGKNGPFRGDKCRTCTHKNECKFHWDITKDERMMNLYANHEHHDGYIRDNCLFREDIDIYDKMSAQVKYANNTVLNYSLTTYSPYEGWRVGINGTEGRIEAWQDIPYFKNDTIDEAEKHAKEMAQTGKDEIAYEPVILHKLWNKHETIQVAMEKSGHGGGDKRLHDKIFKSPETKDPYGRTAGVRDGAMSILIGIGARRSIETGKPIKIADLTDLKPKIERS